MKGDINLKINKKSALLLVGVLSAFAAADFVSMIDIKTAGGISIEKETMTIGSVVFRMDAVNPSTIYGGTWELITGDATLSFGNGSAQSGSSYGVNNPAVPLVAHTHTINHDHPSVSTNTDTHSHGLGRSTNSQGTWGKWANGNGSFGVFSSGSYSEKNLATATDAHNHTVDLPNFTGNSGSAGVSNATIDVRGTRIDINVWKRIG